MSTEDKPTGIGSMLRALEESVAVHNLQEYNRAYRDAIIYGSGFLKVSFSGKLDYVPIDKLKYIEDELKELVNGKI